MATEPADWRPVGAHAGGATPNGTHIDRGEGSVWHAGNVPLPNLLVLTTYNSAFRVAYWHQWDEDGAPIWHTASTGEKMPPPDMWMRLPAWPHEPGAADWND